MSKLIKHVCMYTAHIYFQEYESSQLPYKYIPYTYNHCIRTSESACVYSTLLPQGRREGQISLLLKSTALCCAYYVLLLHSGYALNIKT
jgi:hypothetical protein